MKAADCEVVYVLADPPRPVLPSIALKHRLPTVYQVGNYPNLGGLMAYGPEIKALFFLAAGLRRPYSKGRESGGAARRTADEIRVRRQSPYGQSIGVDHSRAGAADGG